MKRSTLLKHLRKQGCYLKREGREHSLWTNPNTGRLKPYLVTPGFPTSWPGKYAGVSQSLR